MPASIPIGTSRPSWSASLIAPRVARAGRQLSHRARVSGAVATMATTPSAIDPNTVDWQAVVDGRQDVRLAPPAQPRQLDGHDEIHAAQLFRHLPPRHAGEGPFHQERAVDQQRLRPASRITSGSPAGCSTARCPRGAIRRSRKRSTCPQPVPVYMTYLTAPPTAGGVQFLADPYGRDAALMERFGARMVAAPGAKSRRIGDQVSGAGSSAACAPPREPRSPARSHAGARRRTAST